MTRMFVGVERFRRNFVSLDKLTAHVKLGLRVLDLSFLSLLLLFFCCRKTSVDYLRIYF